MENKKMTKVEMFGLIKEIVLASGDENAQEFTDFLDNQIAQINAKAAKAKEKAAEKRANGDELRQAVQAALTDEFQTIDSIMGKIEMEDVTHAKVAARLTQLVKAGLVEKERGKEKVMCYRLISAE